MKVQTRTQSTLRGEAQQVFRQFAWNIAGTLASAKPATRPTRKTRPANARRQAPAK